MLETVAHLFRFQRTSEPARRHNPMRVAALNILCNHKRAGHV